MHSLSGKWSTPIAIWMPVQGNCSNVAKDGCTKIRLQSISLQLMRLGVTRIKKQSSPQVSKSTTHSNLFKIHNNEINSTSNKTKKRINSSNICKCIKKFEGKHIKSIEGEEQKENTTKSIDKQQWVGRHETWKTRWTDERGTNLLQCLFDDYIAFDALNERVNIKFSVYQERKFILVTSLYHNELNHCVSTFLWNFSMNYRSRWFNQCFFNGVFYESMSVPATRIEFRKWIIAWIVLRVNFSHQNSQIIWCNLT